MTDPADTFYPKNFNGWADFWRCQIGVNVIPADTKNKKPLVAWSERQDKPIPEELHNQWKEQDAFSKGIAIISGKVWHREDKNGLFLIFLDLDKLTAIQEVCTNGNGKSISLQKMSQRFIVEQHKDNLDKAHVYFYSPIPFPKKNADSVIGLEVKGLGEHGIAYCSHSIHQQGQPYEIVGTSEPETLTIEQAKEFMQQIDNICKKHGIEYLEKHHKNLLDSNSKVYEGSRHDSLIRIANSLLFRYGDDAKTEQQDLKDFFVDINNKRCEPPLSSNELNSIWEDAVSYYNTKKEQEKEERGRNPHGKRSKEEQQESYAEILVQLATDNTELFFKDQYGTAFALVKVNNDGDNQHREVIRLESNKFKRYLSKLFYDNQNRLVVNSDAINNAVQVLEAKTEYEGQPIPLSLRVASKKENNGLVIYYDLTNLKWQYIKITNHQWELVDNNNSNIPSATLFVRYNQVPQVLPDRNYEPDIFDKFLSLTNINDEQNRLLLKVYVVSLFIPDIAHAILILHGEKGSAKSTLQQLIKLLVDPAKPTLLTIHKDRNEFVQQLNHNHLAFYDNVKRVPYWLSDEACKAVTGIGQTKRKLYSDDDDIVYEYKRCLGFNGINICLTEPDALDRSILIELNRVAKEDRKLESDILAAFGNIRPKLLGYIFDTIVKSLSIKPSILLHDLPRMADFAVWGESISRAMGYKPIEFVNAYNENIGRQNVEAIESNPLAQTVDKFVDSWYKEGKVTFWEDSTKEALEQLNKIAQAYNIDTTSKAWPKAANSLTRRLRPILSNLREGLNINVVISRQTTGDDNKKKNTSSIRIEKICPLSPPSPPDQNQAQNQGKSSGGILDSGDNTSTDQQIPPPENNQNRAQKTESGGSGHSGGLVPSSIVTASEESNADTLKIQHLESVSCSSLPNRYVAFDFEWTTPSLSPSSDDKEKRFPEDVNTPTNKITAAAFVDSQGNSKVLHTSDYSNSDHPEYELLADIIKELLKYYYSLGWYSTGVAKYHEDTQEYLDGVDSDLAVLHNRCLANGVDSIIDFNNAGIPYIRGQTHIDLHSVFGKPMVQTTIFKNAYRTLRLDDVSKAILEDSIEGVGGKYKGLTGKQIQTLPIDEQKKYILRDAQLVMQLSKHNNGEVLDAMKSISEITGLDFERVCRTGISTWWATIFDNILSNGESCMWVA
jgi:Bifunctional DNA primase/polymerase, N-terminal